MSTLRVSNIEAKADVSSPSVHEKIKFTNSEGDVLVHIDGATSGISTVGINTTVKTFDVDSNQNIDFVGNLTAPNITVTGTLSYEDVTSVDAVGLSTFQNGLHVTGGNFGIGTNSPARILHASGSGTQAIRLENTAGTGNAILELKLPSSTFTTGLNPTSIYYDDTAGKEYVWYQNGTERLRITSAGLVGVGVASPSLSYGNGIHIAGGNAGLKLQNTNNGYWAYVEYAKESNT